MPSFVDPASINEVIAKAEALRLETTASAASLYPEGARLSPNNLPLYPQFITEDPDEVEDELEASPLESPWPATDSSATRSRSTTMSGWDKNHGEWDDADSDVLTHWTSHDSGAPSSTAPQLPAQPLPCEFVGLGHCDSTFALDQTKRWINHAMHHFHDNFPPLSLCWFCDTGFRAKPLDSAAARRNTYRTRLDHILAHIRSGEYDAAEMRPDFHLVDHLAAANLITETTAAAGLAWPEDRSLPAFKPPGWEPESHVAARDRASRQEHDLDREDRKRRREERGRKGKEKATRW